MARHDERARRRRHSAALHVRRAVPAMSAAWPADGDLRPGVRRGDRRALSLRMPSVRRAVARAMRAELPRLAVGGCAFERQRRRSLERCRGRLEEHEHLGGALDGEIVDALGDGAEAFDKRAASPRSAESFRSSVAVLTTPTEGASAAMSKAFCARGGGAGWLCPAHFHFSVFRHEPSMGRTRSPQTAPRLQSPPAFHLGRLRRASQDRGRLRTCATANRPTVARRSAHGRAVSSNASEQSGYARMSAHTFLPRAPD